eukprot:COSAG02_NODE_4_length_69935_cov_46.806590_46_plen_113_part_00
MIARRSLTVCLEILGESAVGAIQLKNTVKFPKRERRSRKGRRGRRAGGARGGGEEEEDWVGCARARVRFQALGWSGGSAGIGWDIGWARLGGEGARVESAEKRRGHGRSSSN